MRAVVTSILATLCWIPLLLDAAPAAAQGLGAAVAVSGDEVLVGRPGESTFFPAPASRAGAVHVFRASGGEGEWREVAALTPEDTEVGDGFGEALAADGTVLVVGAPKARGATGATHVYERREGEWRHAAVLAAPEAAAGDSLGFAVAVRSDLVLVGSPGAGGGEGEAHLFRRDGEGGWRHAARLRPDAPADGARFGAAVALVEGEALVGAPGPHPMPSMLGAPPPASAGAVHVFRREGDGWQAEGVLEPEDGDEGAFGFRVLAAAGEQGEADALWVSAPRADEGTGAIVRYVRGPDSGAWSREARVTADEPRPGGLLGSALAVADGDLLAGAPFADNMAGIVYVFRVDPDQGWRQSQTLTSGASGMGILFGSALASGGGRVVAGAPGADWFEGLAYLYAVGSRERWDREATLVDEPAGHEAVTGGEVPCSEGRAAGFDCRGVDLVSFLPVRAIGGERGIMVNDLWGWTDPDTGREYAIVGRFDGTSFVDVSDPTNPVYLGDLPLHEGAAPSLWRDVKVYADHAFIVSDGAGPHGMQVFDLTRLRDVDAPPATFTEDAHYDRVHSAHNLVMNQETGFAYIVGAAMGGETCGGGLHMVDVREPRNPTFAGCHADPRTGAAGTGYVHDAQCVLYRGPDEEHREREICFAASETALGIADVTDKESPVALAAAAYPNVAYAHQGWLTEDHRHFFLDDELDEVQGLVSRTRTLVWDVSDLDDPVLVTEHLGPTAATDHNLYVVGDRMYQSNYVAGLRVLDVSDPADPREIGHFDTVPYGEDEPGFAGSWSNYPFFDSGVVVVSSMKEGLFLLRVRDGRPVSE